jgi:hypothetical protein
VTGDRRAAGRGRRYREWAAIRLEEILAVLQVPAQRAELEDVGLPLPRVHPVGREKEEHPGLTLIGGNLLAAVGATHGEPHDEHMCQDARGAALGGLEEASAGFG